jgi:BirA family biotin operon repressor/biotin-[acetyl-CoA-carboxylase] ligase
LDDPRSLASYQRTDGWLARESRYFTTVTSTNDVVTELAEEGAEEGLLVLSEEQTAGRGRKNRRWLAPPRTCLLLSLLFRPQQPFTYRAPRLTMLCGLSLMETVQEITEVPVMLKWPNDLIVDRAGDWKKVAGMLSEIGGTNSGFLVVGVGLNVNIAKEHLAALAPRATSLMAELGQPVDRVTLLDTFLQRTERLCDRLRSGWDPLPSWRDQLAWMGYPVVVSTPVEDFYGIAEDIADDGALILRGATGERRHFSVGDVSLRQV